MADLENVRRTLSVDPAWFHSAVHVSLERLSDGDMQKLYSCSDAHVLASFGEALGRPYSEAMASGLPVIARAWVGQTHFLNRDNSILVNGTMV